MADPLVGVIMGSRSDWETMRHSCETLEALDVPYETRVVSAHRTPDLMAEYAKTAADRGLKVVIAARIALDVGTDAIFFENPDLPDTHSELALPLRIADEIIGVLDVQSTVSNAFQEEDIEVLSSLADQVAIAIQNASSFETTQELLREAQKVSGTYLQNTWQVLQTEETNLGYRVAGSEVTVLTKPLTNTEVRKAIQNRQTIVENGETATLAVPIRLRDNVIGVMDIKATSEHEWDEDEEDIVESVAERAGHESVG